MRITFSFTLDGIERLKWTEFWQTCRHSHARQHCLFGEIERERGNKPVYVHGEVNGRIVCAGIFSLRRFFLAKEWFREAICECGPAFDDLDHGEYFLREALSYLSSLRVARIQVSPAWYFPEAEPVAQLLMRLGFIPFDGGVEFSTGLIDIRRDEQELILSFDRAIRRQIRAAKKLGISIEPVTQLEEAYLAYNRLRSMRKQRGIFPMSEKEFLAIFEHILKVKDLGILFNAKAGPTFLGGMWCLRSSHTTNPHGYAINPKASEAVPTSFSIGPALWWESLRWAKKKGCSFFDTEGSIEKAERTNPRFGLREFKRRFRPKPASLLNKHVYIVDRSLHSLDRVLYRSDWALRVIMSLPYQFRTRLLPRIRDAKA